MYRLVCMSFDGDYVTEREDFSSVTDAWSRSNDMGSRWFFYPFHFVLTGSGKTIKESPNGLEFFNGRRIESVIREFKALSELPAMGEAGVNEFLLALRLH